MKTDIRQHVWEARECDMGLLGVEDIFFCTGCEACGGPAYQRATPTFRPFFPDGSGLDLSEDCDEAHAQIAIHKTTPLYLVNEDSPTRSRWRRRIEPGVVTFGSADFTFGDVVSATNNAPLSRLSLGTLLWAYGMLVNDQQTPVGTLEKLMPTLTDAIVQSLQDTPLEQQSSQDLAVFSSLLQKASTSGRFSSDAVAQLDRAVKPMVHNWCVKYDKGKTP